MKGLHIQYWLSALPKSFGLSRVSSYDTKHTVFCFKLYAVSSTVSVELTPLWNVSTSAGLWLLGQHQKVLFSRKLVSSHCFDIVAVICHSGVRLLEMVSFDLKLHKLHSFAFMYLYWMKWMPIALLLLLLILRN